MKFGSSFPKGMSRLYLAIGLALVLLGLSLATLEHSTTKSRGMPVFSAPALAAPPIFSTSVQMQSNGAVNPVERTFLYAWPGGDGKEVYVTVSGVESAGSPIFLNIDPGTGPGTRQREKNAAHWESGSY